MATRFFPIYNIDEAVGPRQPNRGDDVRLIQAIFIELSRFSGLDWSQNLPARSRSLAMTGLFDTKLEQWIVEFQNAVVPAFASEFKSDGIIDPLLQAGNLSFGNDFKLGRHATLAFLCNHLWRCNPTAYMKIGEDNSIPWYPSALDPGHVTVG
jgi:hypothetical protein